MCSPICAQHYAPTIEWNEFVYVVVVHRCTYIEHQIKYENRPPSLIHVWILYWRHGLFHIISYGFKYFRCISSTIKYTKLSRLLRTGQVRTIYLGRKQTEHNTKDKVHNFIDTWKTFCRFEALKKIKCINIFFFATALPSPCRPLFVPTLFSSFEHFVIEEIVGQIRYTHMAAKTNQIKNHTNAHTV